MPDKNNMFSIISIPETCSEDWRGMQENENGVYCAKCTKDVVDFSDKSDDEIITYMRSNKDNNVCGRFRNTQLQRILNSQIDKPYRNLAVSALVATGLVVIPHSTLLSAEKDSPTKNEARVDYDSIIDTDYYYMGYILDEIGQPIENANIYYSVQEDKRHLAKTNKKGFFALLTNRKGTYRIIIEKKEYQTKSMNIPITDKGKNSRIRLEHNDDAKRYIDTNVISGSIVDSNGLSILGVNVRIPALGLKVSTDDSGKFAFYKLKDKKYEVEIEIDGFQVQKYILSAPTTDKVFVFNYKNETTEEILKVFGRSHLYDDINEENIGFIK